MHMTKWQKSSISNFLKGIKFDTSKESHKIIMYELIACQRHAIWECVKESRVGNNQKTYNFQNKS